MTMTLTLLACDTQAKAVQAKAYLLGLGYAEADISTEKVTHLLYDAATYDGGVTEALGGKWVVIGRRP